MVSNFLFNNLAKKTLKIKKSYDLCVSSNFKPASAGWVPIVNFRCLPLVTMA